MEKFDWKKELFSKESLKKTFKEMFEELFYLWCVILTAGIILSFQNEQQIDSIISLFKTKNWLFLGVSGVGLLILSELTRRILMGILLVLKFIFLLIFKRKKERPF